MVQIMMCRLCSWLWGGTLAILLVMAACSKEAGPAPDIEAGSTVRISVKDAATGAPTPARVELLDARGTSVLPPKSLEVRGDCSGSPDSKSARIHPGGNALFSPDSGTMQFYVDGTLDVPVSPGAHRITVQKGPEYEPVVREFVIAPGETRALEVSLVRWVNMPGRGWFSADGHLHIDRRKPEDDASLFRWMQAEDLHVANMLQMGKSSGALAAEQSAFGKKSVARRGNTLLASGQENPRAWILGHAILFGATGYVSNPQAYLGYRQFWEAAERQGGIGGYAHFAGPGLMADASTGLLTFLEVLQFGTSRPAALYDLLNLGFRIAPIAGTDFPCFPSGPPGSERFYTRVEGPLTYETWLDGVRAGRTFVTNGPMVEFTIDGVGIGGDLVLPAPSTVEVVATIRFDPTRDEIAVVELVRAGEVVFIERERLKPGVIELRLNLPVEETTWFAVRARGSKTTGFGGMDRLSVAHSGAIFVDVAGTPGLADQPRARRLAKRVLEKIDILERQFSEDALRRIRTPLARSLTGITAEVGLRDREVVVESLDEARKFYKDRARVD